MSPCARGLSFIQLFVTPWTEACKAPLPMGFPGWVAISSSGGFPDPGIEPPSSALSGRFFIAERLEKPIKEDNWCQFKRSMGRVAECSSSHMVHIGHGDWKPIRIEFPGSARGHGVLKRRSAKCQPPTHPFNRWEWSCSTMVGSVMMRSKEGITTYSELNNENTNLPLL